MSNPTQTFIPGCEPVDPDQHDDIDSALDAWLEAKVEQRRAADTTKIHHLSLLAKLGEYKLERYPFVDRTTGKKRYVVIARDPKAKTIKAPTVKSEKRKAKSEAKKAEDDDKVEVRRVSRASVENADAVCDPFGSTRAGMEH